jgi:hypothetical protein
MGLHHLKLLRAAQLSQDMGKGMKNRIRHRNHTETPLKQQEKQFEPRNLMGWDKTLKLHQFT